MNRLLALYSRNKHRGFSALSQNEGTLDLYLYDAIVATDDEAQFFGGISAQSLVPQIRTAQVETINLRINSPGGDVFAGRAIEQALRDSAATVNVFVDGVAASAASIVAMGGDTVSMARGSMMMIHRAWTLALGNTNDLIETAALLEKVDQSLAQTYASRTGGSVEDAIAAMDAETWMTADEAIEAGYADSVIDAPIKASKRSPAWDLSAYTRAPAEPQTTEQQPDASEESHDARGFALALQKLREVQGRI